MRKTTMEMKELVGTKEECSLSIQYGKFSPVMMLRMSKRYLYFDVSKLVEIKNHLAESIRELKILRNDWRENCKTSSKSKVRINVASGNTVACMEPSGFRFSCETQNNTAFFVTLYPVDANTFLRDIKDALLKIRLKKKKNGVSDKK